MSKNWAVIDERFGDARGARNPHHDAIASARSSAARRVLSPFSPAAPAGRAGFSSVMAPNLDGDTYWFHRQLDFRDLSRK